MQNTSRDYVDSLPLVLPLPSQREQTIVTNITDQNNAILFDIIVMKKKTKKPEKTSLNLLKRSTETSVVCFIHTSFHNYFRKLLACTLPS